MPLSKKKRKPAHPNFFSHFFSPFLLLSEEGFFKLFEYIFWSIPWNRFFALEFETIEA